MGVGPGRTEFKHLDDLISVSTVILVAVEFAESDRLRDFVPVAPPGAIFR